MDTQTERRPRYILVAPDGAMGISCHKPSSLRAAAHFSHPLFEIDRSLMRELGRQPRSNVQAWCEANGTLVA